MRKQLLALCLLWTCSAAIGSDTIFLRTHIRVNEFAAKDWSVSSIDAPHKPYGWDQTEGQDSGLAVTLEGPNTVLGAKRELRKEGLTIFIMPKEFVPTALPPPGPAEFASTFLGRTSHGEKIYVKVWSEIQTWKNWRADIQEYFKIDPNQFEGMR
jgi:hypothetical protein